MSRNIYIEPNIVCPVCKNQFKGRYTNPRFYVAAGRDSDQRVTGYNWAQGIKTDEVPHYYAVTQCPQCLFADLRENLENPKPGTKETKLYEARRSLEFKQVVILKKLRKLVPEEGKMDLKGAISLHMAAIFNALLPAQEFIDHNRLGRLYLRLSWLYRELQGDETETVKEQENQGPSLSLEKLVKMSEGMQSNLQGFSVDLGEMRKLASARSAELGVAWEEEKNPYFALSNSLEYKLTEIQTLMEMIQQSIVKDKKGVLIRPMEDVAAIFANEEAQKQLNEIASKWPDYPDNENYCLKRAIEAFDYSYKNEDAERSTEQSLAIVNLIVKLYLKAGNLNSALDYILQMLKNGSREKQSLQMRLGQGKQNKSLTEFDEKSILRKMATINSSLTQGMEIRDNIMEMLFTKNKENIFSIMKANLSKTSNEQQQALLNAGIPEGLIPFLRSKGLIKEDDSQKGWFTKKK